MTVDGEDTQVANANVHRKPVTGPHVWFGETFTDREDWIFHLSAAHIDELNHAVSNISTSIPEMYNVTATEFPLPALAEALGELDKELQRGRGFILLRGLPVGRYTEEQLAAIFWGIGSHLGVGWRKAGRATGWAMSSTAPDRKATCVTCEITSLAAISACIRISIMTWSDF